MQATCCVPSGILSPLLCVTCIDVLTYFPPFFLDQRSFNQSAPGCSLSFLPTALSVGVAVFLSGSEKKSLLQRFALLILVVEHHSTVFAFWQAFLSEKQNQFALVWHNLQHGNQVLVHYLIYVTGLFRNVYSGMSSQFKHHLHNLQRRKKSPVSHRKKCWYDLSNLLVFEFQKPFGTMNCKTKKLKYFWQINDVIKTNLKGLLQNAASIQDTDEIPVV